MAWQRLTTGWTLYIVVAVAFLVFMIFFDRNSPIVQFRLSRKINHAEREIRQYKEQIDIYKSQIEKIKTSDKALEEYAREHYYMKAADEDVYIVSEED